MPTGENPGDTDPDIDPLAAPTAPLPLNEPTIPLARDGQTQVIARDGHTIPIEGPIKPEEKPPNAEKPPDEPAVAKYKAEYLATNPDAINEPAGQKAASQAGIERDGELKEMPGAILDIELRIAPYLDLKAQDPKKAFAIVKSAIARFQGALLHFIPTPKGYLRCQCIFPNKAQAHNAAVYIHQNSDTDEDDTTPIKKAKFGLGADDISLATYNGHLLVLGNGARMAFKMQHANSELAETPTVATYEKDKPILGNALREDELTELTPLHSRKTPKSKDHAQSAVRLPNPDLPQVASRVEIRFPKALVEDPEKMLKIATRLLDGISPHPMPKDSKYTPTHVNLSGQVLTVYLPEERAPGNLGERLNSLTEEIEENGLVIILSHSKYSVMQLDEENHTFQGILPATATLGEELDLDGSTGTAGIYIDEPFKKAAAHERNASIANFATNDKPAFWIRDVQPPRTRNEVLQPQKRRVMQRNFYKVNSIQIAQEAIVKGRYTVGREKEVKDLEATLAKVRETGLAEFTIINGEAGIGKTRHAIDAVNKATEQGFSSVYYKTPENGKTASLTGVRRMTKNLLSKLPGKDREDFRDLQFFSEGIVPPGETDRYGKRVEALNQNQVLAADRLTSLIVKCAQSQAFQLILDDLQWFDELSIAILKKVIEDLPQETQVHLALLGRSGEEPIPQDLIEAVAKRTGHNHMVELCRIGDSARLRSEIQTETPAITDQDLSDAVHRKRFQLSKDYIYANLPDEYAEATMADDFVWKILEISEGLPIVISETVSLLLEEGKIALKGETLATPANAELDELKKDSTTETLSSVIQAKFDRLSEDEKAVVDYLVVLGETDLRLLAALLKHLRFCEERIGGIIASLKQKGIIKTKPVSFTHDLMRTQREMHLQGRGSLSHKAAKCYIPLAKHRSRYATLISPSQVFGLLETALKNPEQCTAEVKAKLLEDQVPLGLEAADHNLQTQNQYRALQIVTSLEAGLAKQFSAYTYPPGSEAPDAAEKKTALAQSLGEIHLRAAEAHIRLGHKTEPEAALRKYAQIAQDIPDAKLKEGEKGFRYKVLCLKAAFVKRSPNDLRAAMAELDASPEFVSLKVALTEATVESEPPLHVLIAYGELALAKLRLAGLRQSREAYNAALPTARETEQKLASSNSKAALALRMDISRSIHVYDAHLYRKEICGAVEDAFYMQEFTSEQIARAAALEQQLTGILQAYLADTELVRDPQTLGFLYERLADMQIVQGNREEARKTVERGLRLSNNWGIPEAVGALSALYGDERTTTEIAKIDLEAKETIDCAKSFDMESLQSALESYSQGILAMEKMGATDAPYLEMNTANKALCMALYTFAKLVENPEFDTKQMSATTGLHMPTAEKLAEIDKLTSQIRLTWSGMVRVILQLKSHYDKDKPPNDPYNEGYLRELCTLGLLYKAAQRIGISDIAIPDFVEMTQIYTQYGYLNEVIDKPDKPHSDADKKYLKLRKEGIVALLPGGMEIEIHVADLKDLL